jgi:ankyrin repeat protein
VDVNCKLETVKTLLMLGAPTDMVDVDNMTPLHYTVRHGRQDLAKLLLHNEVPVDIALQRKAWTSKNHEGRTIFELARGHQIPSVERRYMQGLTPLHYVALVGNSQMVQFFLDHGADPNAVSYYGETSLHLTISKNLQGSQYSDDWTEDHWTEDHLRVEVLLELIDPEDDDANETYADIARRRIAVIDRLLSHPKADVNVQDSEGASALHRAPYGKLECAIIARKLIEKGADVSASNSRKQCPLQLACLNGDFASVKVLLSHGADILYVGSQPQY